MKEKIIVALDVSTVDEALSLSSQLSDHVGGFKLGFEFFYSTLASLMLDPMVDAVTSLHKARQLFEQLAGRVFLDVKFEDIPETVKKAARTLARFRPKFINLHAAGGKKMMLAAKEGLIEAGLGDIPVLAVTVLTSLDFQALLEIGVCSSYGNMSEGDGVEEIRAHVITRAMLAKKCGLAGVIASAQEAPFIRRMCGDDFLIVTPGIRTAWATWAGSADQARILTPQLAIEGGSDYLVIGRPIVDTPESEGGPVATVKRIVAELSQSY
ncbi:MAG: orotidine 5'-phosphate decarboxylase [Candidatus Doudnabacteria bacterium RIFCSPHIGHO2_01_FULL_50_11]|uniref:Orotidine 5'-phosphate decarboxylase n=1 Tax=Candidatus Doudnabacteria bacterium RIFCSPHIGHO2_01_FULL_50_11 TaxID=1817828 RepID=A0A1F5PMQ2_9BACT|nr:MAG: orotidine 5'-phosphate decarboxylase [Candidatus Doudnabacteria bacterium RIFCSPHIGHO2_01_FULL_50_11]HLC44680.1 orotidine-5'-phosphate decarboxylase [Patescibacteria group bacterium]